MTDLIAILIVLCSIAYALWLIYQVLTDRHNPCNGCDGCALKGVNARKEHCDKKK